MTASPQTRRRGMRSRSAADARFASAIVPTDVGEVVEETSTTGCGRSISSTS
jgi:hypothetical protein